MRRTISTREAALALVLVDDRRDLGEHEVADRRRAAARARGRGRGPCAGERSTGDSAPRALGASLPGCPSPTSVGRRRTSRPPWRARIGRRRRRPVRAFAATSCSASASTARRSPDQLAARLGASRTGVLQQLRALEAAGLVSRQTVRHGVGRPRHLYDVTPDAQDLVPVELRRARGGPAGGDRGGRRRRAGRGGLRGPAPADRRRVREPARRAAARRRAAGGPRPRARGHPGRAGLSRRGGRSTRDGVDPAPRAQLRDLPRRQGHAGGLPGRARAVPRGPRRRRRPRERTSRRATAAARTGSRSGRG